MGDGLLAATLNYDYEVRSSAEVFADIPKGKIEREMLDLARHIIDTKRGAFEPEAFEDRYDAALAELVRAKMEGRKIRKPKAPARDKVVDLMQALRDSAGAAAKPAKPTRRKSAASSKAKGTDLKKAS